MNGELIPSAYTIDQGRVALNDSFSATAYFTNVEASANITGGTYYSGSTPLTLIIQNLAVAGSVTYVQPGLNTYTGGTSTNPTVNISAATLSSLSSTTISGGTIYSGGTNLYDIFCSDCGFSGFSSSTGAFSIIENNGTGNVASDSFGFAGGNASSSNNYGEWSRTSGGALGQFGFATWYGSTTLAPSNISELYLDGGSLNKKFVLPYNSSYYFDITIAARVIGGVADGDSAVWTTQGMSNNIAGVVADLIDTGGQYYPMTAKVLGASFTSSTAIVSAETSTSAVTITVVGPDENVDWFIKAEYTKVQ